MTFCACYPPRASTVPHLAFLLSRAHADSPRPLSLSASPLSRSRWAGGLDARLPHSCCCTVHPLSDVDRADDLEAIQTTSFRTNPPLSSRTFTTLKTQQIKMVSPTILSTSTRPVDRIYGEGDQGHGSKRIIVRKGRYGYRWDDQEFEMEQRDERSRRIGRWRGRASWQLGTDCPGQANWVWVWIRVMGSSGIKEDRPQSVQAAGNRQHSHCQHGRPL